MNRPWPDRDGYRAARNGSPRKIASGALLAMALMFGACKGDGGGPVGLEPSIAGHWTGTAKLHTVRFEADFTQSGEVVGGTGEFSSPLASDDFTVAGTLRGRDVSLTLTSDELGATTFLGRFVAADRIEGTFDPNGRYEMDLTLERD